MFEAWLWNINRERGRFGDLNQRLDSNIGVMAENSCPGSLMKTTLEETFYHLEMPSPTSGFIWNKVVATWITKLQYIEFWPWNLNSLLSNSLRQPTLCVLTKTLFCWVHTVSVPIHNINHFKMFMTQPVLQNEEDLPWEESLGQCKVERSSSKTPHPERRLQLWSDCHQSNNVLLLIPTSSQMIIGL